MTNLLDNIIFEVIPLRGVDEKVERLPPGARVSVTASPTKGIGPTLDLALRLQRRGFAVTPHLSARLIKDRQELESIIQVLASERVTRALVVGGDSTDPGKYSDALDLLRAMDEVGHHFSEVAIAGYPEGHPFISGDQLRQALIDKQHYANYITTQMCFDVRAMHSWLKGIRLDRIILPVRVGIPGVVDPIKLARIATRIGVGTSMRYIMRNRNVLLRLLRPGAYRPTKLVNALSQIDQGLALAGLHIFTFNQIEPTMDWLERAGDN